MVREFRPPVVRKGARLALAALFGTLLLVSSALLGAIALGSGQVTYTIQGGELRVRSGSAIDGTRRVALDDVREARAVELRGGRRKMGTGMPGLCSGRWAYQGIGEVWQATDCSSRAVLLEVRGEPRPLVVTPPDPDAFLDALRTRSETTIALPPADAVWLRVVPAASALLSLTGLALLIALFARGPERMRYVVRSGELEVHTMFTKRSWRASRFRARPYAPQRALRVVGSALPGYYTGRFRADGEPLRVFATSFGAGVLLEGPERIFLSPEDPQAFLRALREAGAVVTT